MGINKSESLEQNRMSSKGQRKIRITLNAIVMLMLVMVFILAKNDFQRQDAWISIVNATCVAAIYLLTLYYRYVCFPEYQKKLKAIVDAVANFLALIAIIITFISVVLTGKASSLYVDLAEGGGTSIIFGVIIGVLSSRVLFPFWDIYSKYRKV
jgi:predicted membrane channel-forming protein YqfA (hemolysin III family)